MNSPSSRRRSFVALIAFLATFLWLLGPDLPAGPAALWPSALAVGLAFLTRNIYSALFLGAFAGALLLHGGHPWLAFQDLFATRLIPSLSDRWNISVLIFTLLMGGLAELLNRNGGMAALSARIMGGSATRRRAGLSAYLLGWLLFIDGLANAMLVGKTLRPITDRAGLSREKLAFIVDATSAPIAGLALISTWVAYEMSVIREGFAIAGNPTWATGIDPFGWLLLSLPFRFYNWFMLLIVFLVVWLMRDYGPMLGAERATAATRPPATRPLEPESSGWRAALALIPISLLVIGVFGGLFVSGGGLSQPLSLNGVVLALGKADAALVFVLATAVTVAVALLLSSCCPTPCQPSSKADSPAPGLQAFLEGMQQMFLPALILVLAWMLNSVIKELGAADFLIQLLSDRLPVAWLPALVFLVAALTSFSTGTSWGTMAMVMPLSIPLAVTLTASDPGTGPVMAATVGAVLAGAVFGDHCSPISDTTIVSAFSSNCDVMGHVRTQIPYALTAAGIALFLGYAPAGWGISPWFLLPLGALACWSVVRFGGTQTQPQLPSSGRSRS